jgi:hypothetical protein
MVAAGRKGGGAGVDIGAGHGDSESSGRAGLSNGLVDVPRRSLTPPTSANPVTIMTQLYAIMTDVLRGSKVRFIHMRRNVNAAAALCAGNPETAHA